MFEMSDIDYFRSEIDKIDVSYLLERPEATPMHRTREMCADKFGAFVVLAAATAYQTVAIATQAARKVKERYGER